MPETRSKKLKLRVNGSTSNLGSGFDTLGLAVSLPLIVRVTTGVPETDIRASGEGAHQIGGTEGNLFWSAFETLFRQQKMPTPNCLVQIENHIPLKRGLGSSGAAIVAGLLAANELIDTRLSQSEILDLACSLEGHPENVSASLLGGMTVSFVRESKVLCESIAPPSNWTAVCFVPEQQITTGAARSVLPEMIPFSDAVTNLQAVAMMVLAFKDRTPSLLEVGAFDRLHQPYRQQLIEGYDDFAAAIANTRAFCFFISGSGSAMMAICDVAASDEVCETLNGVAAERGIRGRVLRLTFASTGAEVLEQQA